MPHVYQLTSFEIDEPRQVCTVSATTAPSFTNLREVIEIALPGATCVRAAGGGLSFQLQGAIHINGLAGKASELTELLTLASTCICIVDQCDISECLDFYRIPTESSESPEDWPYTPTGMRLYRAKYGGQVVAANELGQALVRHVQAHPAMRRATVVSAIPSSGQHSRPDLPARWSRAVSAALLLDGTTLLRRTRPVASQKEITDMTQRRANQLNSMAFQTSLNGEAVLLIDDLYTGGETMTEGCRAARAAGARVVMGLSVAKTVKGSQGFWL